MTDFFFKHIWYNFINLKMHELKVDTGGIDPNNIEIYEFLGYYQVFYPKSNELQK